MSVLVVTGTDTGVGKTIVSAALALAPGRTYVKVAQTGDDDDAGEVARLTGAPVHTLARFDAPLAPASAGTGITAEEVVAALPPGDLVIEGAGGMLVQLGADGSTLAEVAALLGAPVLVVARAGLGTLNHTALTCEALAARGLICPGVVIGSWPAAPGLAERSNLGDLPLYAGVPLLGRVPEGAGRLAPADFAARAPTWISQGLLT
ncbi:MAG: ATP-dependent dethiobiotin synthetase BioD [Solirubrobacteraceae bacterium]